MNKRERARAAGRETYTVEVVEHWPACVTCGEVIRQPARFVQRPGLYRLCRCQGVVWRSSHIVGEGWVRMRDDEL